MLSPAELATYRVSGYGGSDLTPALRALADDPRVTAAIVLTDGDIAYPRGADAVCRAVGTAAARPCRVSPRLRARDRHAARRPAMKVVQELVAYFDRQRKALAEAAAQAARTGFSGG